MTWLIKTVILGLVVCVAVCLGLWLSRRPEVTTRQPDEVMHDVQRAADAGAELTDRAVEAAKAMPEKIRQLAAPPSTPSVNDGPSLGEREAKWTREWEVELVRLQELHKDLVLDKEPRR